MRPFLDARGISIEFRNGKHAQRVVRQASFCLHRGKTAVLAGESGAGKSLTARALTALLPAHARATAGEIRVGEEVMAANDPVRLALLRGHTVAYIFQEPGAYLNPVLTIGAQIAEAFVTHQRLSWKEAGTRALDLLETVRIGDPRRIAASYPHQLSGGMNQRAAIAQALACDPAVLVADEPTTSLDAATEYQIVELLKELCASRDFALLFITHNLGLARRIADCVYIMYQGSVVEEGSPDNIFSSPRHPHTQLLIRAYERIGRI
jgi:peptide/nickel transport system ATP-binding protein